MSSMPEVTRARQDYLMARRDGGQRIRPKGVPSGGASPDYHVRYERDWLWMQEVAWDLYRNNMVLGSITDRAVDQTLQGGFGYSPETGDDKLDADLDAWWKEISKDPKECDPNWEDTFADQEELVLRAMFVPGELFAIPLEDGQVDLVEGSLCRSPTDPRSRKPNKTRGRIVHGKEFYPGTRRVKNYHFLKGDIDPFQQVSIRLGSLEPIPAWDEDDHPNVFHVHHRKRPKQSRGVSAYNPIFEAVSYHDDIQFLAMVQARAQSLVAFIENRDESFDEAFLEAERRLEDSESSDEDRARCHADQFKSMSSGSWVKSLPGATISAWSSQVPGPRHEQHMRMLLTFIGVNLGMPLIMALMDASQGSWSSIRGAVDMARVGFAKNQRRLASRFHEPYKNFKIRHHARFDSTMQRQVERSLNPRSKVNIFRGRWDKPTWASIRPLEDATANTMRSANSQVSPSQLARESGEDWQEQSQEIRRDRTAHLEAAIQAAKRLIDEYGLSADPLTLAMQIAPMPSADGISVNVSADADGATPVAGEVAA